MADSVMADRVMADTAESATSGGPVGGGTILHRSADWDTPWWVRPNRAEGRWNRPGAGPVQYLCDHPLGPVAERLRHLGRDVLADVRTLRWRTWVMRVPTGDLLTIGFDDAHRFGLEPADLVSDDWAPCQALADRLAARGVPGIIVPSAALPGVSVVVLFGPRVAAPLLATPVDPGVDVPTAHAAEWSVPAAEILGAVRWWGEPHAGLQAWMEGDRHRFRDPPVRAHGPGRP